MLPPLRLASRLAFLPFPRHFSRWGANLQHVERTFSIFMPNSSTHCTVALQVHMSLIVLDAQIRMPLHNLERGGRRRRDHNHESLHATGMNGIHMTCPWPVMKQKLCIPWLADAEFGLMVSCYVKGVMPLERSGYATASAAMHP